MKSNKLLQQQEQNQETRQIPQELVEKFDNDAQLVDEFLDQGYTVDELLSSTVTHPTKLDPVCTLQDGQQAGIWLYKDNNTKTNTKIQYRP